MGDAVRDVEDMKCLKLVAEELHRELSGRLGRLIRLRTKLQLKESHTNGWRVELGSLGLGEPRLEVWYCEWAREGERRLWYGFYAAQADKLRRRIAVLPESLRAVRQVNEKDMRLASGSRSDSVLKKPLADDVKGTGYFLNPQGSIFAALNPFRLITNDLAQKGREL